MLGLGLEVGEWVLENCLLQMGMLKTTFNTNFDLLWINHSNKLGDKLLAIRK